MQLKNDIQNEVNGSVSAAKSFDKSIDLQESSDLPQAILPTLLTLPCDLLLNSINDYSSINNSTPDDQDNTVSASMLRENEFYQLFLGYGFKSDM
jgi:hypothetical protein